MSGLAPIGTILPVEVEHAAHLWVQRGSVHETSALSRSSALCQCMHHRPQASQPPLTVLHRLERREAVPEPSAFSADRVEVRRSHLSSFSIGGNNARPCQNSRRFPLAESRSAGHTSQCSPSRERRKVVPELLAVSGEGEHVSSGAEDRAAGADDVPVEVGARLGRPLLRREVDMDDAEALGEAPGPFQVVEEGPDEVAA